MTEIRSNDGFGEVLNWDREAYEFQGRILSTEIPKEFSEQIEMVIQCRMCDLNIHGHPMCPKLWYRKVEGDIYQVMNGDVVVWSSGTCFELVFVEKK